MRTIRGRCCDPRCRYSRRRLRRPSAPRRTSQNRWGPRRQGRERASNSDLSDVYLAPACEIDQMGTAALPLNATIAGQTGLRGGLRAWSRRSVAYGRLEACAPSRLDTKLACLSPRDRLRCDPGSVSGSSWFASRMKSGGTYNASRAAPRHMRTRRWRGRDSRSGLTRWTQRIAGETRRGLVGRPRCASASRANWPSARGHLAERHAHAHSSVGTRRSADHQS